MIYCDSVTLRSTLGSFHNSITSTHNDHQTNQTSTITRNMFQTWPLLQASQRVYKARHPWPPDFSLLSQKDQFRLERRYRRRSKLKWARPRLQKAVTLAQWGGIAFVVTYGVFIADWDSDSHVFKPIRDWVKEVRFWSTPAPPGPDIVSQSPPATDGKR